MPRDLNGLWGEWPSNLFGVQETEHTAGFPMTGHYRQTTVAFTFLALFGQPCGGECRFSCFSSPIADNIPQCPDQSKKQEYEQ